MGDSLSSIRDEERWENAKKSIEQSKKIANIQYKKYCERLEERDNLILDLQLKYTDAVFKMQEMENLLKECLEYITQPSLIENIAIIINK